MKTTVKTIVKTRTNGAYPDPVSYAELACGHAGHTKLKPAVNKCERCPNEFFEHENKGRGCPCGSKCLTRSFSPHGHNDILTKVGDEYECERCDHHVVALAKLKAAVAGELEGVTVTHTRASRLGDRIHVYRREPASPTGVQALMSIDDTPEVQAVLRGGLSPLSPTEGRGR